MNLFIIFRVAILAIALFMSCFVNIESYAAYQMGDYVEEQGRSGGGGLNPFVWFFIVVVVVFIASQWDKYK